MPCQRQLDGIPGFGNLIASTCIRIRSIHAMRKASPRYPWPSRHLDLGTIAFSTTSLWSSINMVNVCGSHRIAITSWSTTSQPMPRASNRKAVHLMQSTLHVRRTCRRVRLCPHGCCWSGDDNPCIAMNEAWIRVRSPGLRTPIWVVDPSTTHIAFNHLLVSLDNPLRSLYTTRSAAVQIFCLINNVPSLWYEIR